MSVDILFSTTNQVDYVSRWLARGFMTTVVIYTFSEISGAHVDPAVTFGFALRRDFPARSIAAYWGAQFAGSLAAVLLLQSFFGRRIAYGASHPGPHVSPLVAVLCEAVLTAIVMLVILVTAQERSTVGKQAAVAVGMSVAACGFFAGPISGASMNPARSIVPQLLSGQFDLAWIYAVGPLAGAALAVGIHRWMCGAPNQDEREAATGE